MLHIRKKGAYQVFIKCCGTKEINYYYFKECFISSVFTCSICQGPSNIPQGDCQSHPSSPGDPCGKSPANKKVISNSKTACLTNAGFLEFLGMNFPICSTIKRISHECPYNWLPFNMNPCFLSNSKLSSSRLQMVKFGLSEVFISRATLMQKQNIFQPIHSLKRH